MLDDALTTLPDESTVLRELFRSSRSEAILAAEQYRQFNAKARQRLTDARALLDRARVLTRPDSAVSRYSGNTSVSP